MCCLTRFLSGISNVLFALVATQYFSSNVVYSGKNIVSYRNKNLQRLQEQQLFYGPLHHDKHVLIPTR
jgi:hypothetical protein